MESQSLGQCLGSYRLVRSIARGGMGEVFEAEHVLLGRKAAVKVLLPELSRRADSVDRFFNEARTAASIRHPGMVEVFDFGYLESGSAYIVMELLEGKTLEDVLGERSRITPLEAVTLARQVAMAMAAAHALGIVHRDLKPENICLVPCEEAPGGIRAKVLDFGVAKLTRSEPGTAGTTRTGQIIGTPLYMAPEQCHGAHGVDGRADIYALGCILYDMLCGGPPFDSQGVGAVIAAHLYEDPVPPRRRVPAIPAALDALVLRLLAKSPDERPQSMIEVDALLANVLAPLEQPELEVEMEVECELELDGAPGTPPRATAAPIPAVSAIGSGPILIAPLPPVSPSPSMNGELTAPPPQSQRRALFLSGGAALAVLAVTTLAAATHPNAAPAPAPSRELSIAGAALVPRLPVVAVAPSVETPRTVRLRVESRPPRAEVYRMEDGRAVRIGRTPLVLEMPAGSEALNLHVKKRGYAAEYVEVDTGRDSQAKVVLSRKPRGQTQAQMQTSMRAPSPKLSVKDGALDPFAPR